MLAIMLFAVLVIAKSLFLFPVGSIVTVLSVTVISAGNLWISLLTVPLLPVTTIIWSRFFISTFSGIGSSVFSLEDITYQNTSETFFLCFMMRHYSFTRGNNQYPHAVGRKILAFPLQKFTLLFPE